jgi:hypothetical protein
VQPESSDKPGRVGCCGAGCGNHAGDITRRKGMFIAILVVILLVVVITAVSRNSRKTRMEIEEMERKRRLTEGGDGV